MKCVMCKKEGVFIDKKTDEALCERCVNINEGIYRDKGEAGKYMKLKEGK